MFRLVAKWIVDPLVANHHSCFYLNIKWVKMGWHLCASEWESVREESVGNHGKQDLNDHHHHTQDRQHTTSTTWNDWNELHAVQETKAWIGNIEPPKWIDGVVHIIDLHDTSIHFGVYNTTESLSSIDSSKADALGNGTHHCLYRHLPSDWERKNVNKCHYPLSPSSPSSPMLKMLQVNRHSTYT